MRQVQVGGGNVRGHFGDAAAVPAPPKVLPGGGKAQEEQCAANRAEAAPARMFGEHTHRVHVLLATLFTAH